MKLDLNFYLICLLAGIIGIALHIFAIKLPNTIKRAKVANTPFSYSKYFADDLVAIIASFLTVFAFLIVLSELVAFKPEVVPFIKVGFIFVGFTGSSIVLGIFSQAQKRLNKIIDVKTDELDELKGK